MFGKKELQRELEQKEQQIQELNRRIKEYQDKNDAVVSALTDAKSAANRIIGAAEAKRDDIIAAAMREKADMEAQRDGILDEARAQAAAIVADAEKRAKAAEEQARYFQDYIRNTADTVRRQAENYAGFLENYEHIGVGQQPETEKIDTPDEYRNPAELIKSIYNIEGRELPDEVTKPDAGQEPEEEKVWTVDEVVSEEKHDDDDADKADGGLDSELNDILNDILKLD